MLLNAYYSQNYASIMCQGLAKNRTELDVTMPQLEPRTEEYLDRCSLALRLCVAVSVAIVYGTYSWMGL